MNRLIIYIFLITGVFTNYSFAQVPLNVSKSLRLEGWVAQMDRNEKFKLSKTLAVEPELEWAFDWRNREDSSSIDNLHIVDFDCDGLLDVIYDGSIGSESDRIVFMKGESDGSFSKVIGLWGEFVDISKNDGFTPMSFMINNYSCCAGVMHHLERYTPVWTSLGLEFKLQVKYAKYYTMELPKERFKSPIGFVTTYEKYNLRLEPSINDTIALEQNKKGNIMAEYPKRSEGIAIAEHIDKTGRVWWFVIMKNNTPPNWSVYYNGDNNDAKSYFLGWISSRYVERL